MSRCCSFIKRVCLCTLSGGHCDTVWYVESYKQLALNSICKINSPRAGAAHIRLLPSSRPRFLPPFLVCLSSCSFSNSPFQSALCSVLPLLHSSDSISTPPPIHLPDITDLTGHFVVIDAVARGPAGGRRHLGTRSAPTGQRSGFWSDGCRWHHPQGTCMCRSPHISPCITWPVFARTSSLSLCHPSPSCCNKAPVCVDLRFSFNWLAKLPNAPCFIWI